MTYELAREWVRNGHQVTVLTSDQKDGANRFPELTASLDGIEVRRFRNRYHRLAARYSFLFFRPLGMQAALKAAGGKFDVVHVAESRGPHNRWVARCIPPLRIPIVWSAYGGLADGEGPRRLYRSLHDVFSGTRDMVRRADGLIAQTSHEREVYLRFGADPARISLIPLAVNWNDFANLPERGQFRNKLGIARAGKLILFVGRIHSTKGLQVLIPAFADAIRLFPRARLAIVGWDHGFLEAARKLVGELGLGESVLFPGPLYGPDRFAAYVDADVFALTPGVYEETSLAALEACASGIGCVITRQCEIPGLDQSNSGRTVEYSRGAVTAALNEALGGEVAAVWGRNARIMVQRQFTSATVAKLHEDVFERFYEGTPISTTS
jgi:glycosyltransferase involved in cell wall biosynthesis